jgi:hypothetical protein
MSFSRQNCTWDLTPSLGDCCKQAISLIDPMMGAMAIFRQLPLVQTHLPMMWRTQTTINA